MCSNLNAFLLSCFYVVNLFELLEDSQSLVPGYHHRHKKWILSFSPIKSNHNHYSCKEDILLCCWTLPDGHPFSAYADSLPRNLRTLSLTGMMVEPGAMASAGKKVPDILHLRYDPFVFNGPSYVAEIPGVFPLLQTLKVRWESMLMCHSTNGVGISVPSLL